MLGLGALAFALAAVLGRLAAETFLLGLAFALTTGGSLARAGLGHLVMLGLDASLILRRHSYLGAAAVNARQPLDALSVSGQLVHQIAVVVHPNALGAVDRAPAQVQLLAGALDNARVDAALALDPRLAAVGGARLASALAHGADRHAHCLLAEISNAHRGVAARHRHDLVVIVRAALASLARLARFTRLRRLALDVNPLALLFLVTLGLAALRQKGLALRILRPVSVRMGVRRVGGRAAAGRI